MEHSEVILLSCCGLWERLRELLVEKSRVDTGREPNPTYGIIDSQSSKRCIMQTIVALMGGKTKSRKRHIITEKMGNLLAITVHAANIHDTIGAATVYDKVLETYPSIQGISGDMGNRGTFVKHVT